MILVVIAFLVVSAGAGVYWLIASSGSSYWEDHLISGGLFWVFGVLFVLSLFAGIHWEYSEDLVSGVVYNTQVNTAVSGNTTFSVRAGVDTYVSEENKSSYCLPAGSPYIPLVKRAAADKTVKVIVTTRKDFMFAAPWVCMDNVTVTEETK